MGCGEDVRIFPIWAKPVAFNMLKAPPGPANYQKGYRDGCESGYKGYGMNYNKVWFEFRQDETLRHDPVYYQIWKDAYAYCAAVANSTANHGWGNME